MKDLRGNEIKLGSMVAYNRSGDVVLGQVKGFSKRQRRQFGCRGLCIQLTFIPTYIKVRNSQDGKLSKVKRPESMMVIYETP